MLKRLAFFVLCKARDDAALDADLLLVLANDPQVSPRYREDFSRDLKASLEAHAFLHGSPAFRLWALAAGLRPGAAAETWERRTHDPCLL